MGVEVWYGETPHHEAEQKALLELYQYLHPQQDRFILLHNFCAGQGSEIDLIVLKHDGVFLAELKRVWDPTVGGRWIVRDLGSTSGTFVSYTGDPDTESRVVDTEFALQNNSIVCFGPAAYTLLLLKGEEQ